MKKLSSGLNGFRSKIVYCFLLGAFAKLRNASSCQFDCRPPCPHGTTDFHEILYLCIFRTYVEKTQVSLKSDKNNGYFI
jgi:hypothetical protein